jgi:GTP-binding protein YchF
LGKIFIPPKTIPTYIEFVDIAGLVKGASKGEGLGNQFLAKIREVDAIAHIVRCFEDPNVSHLYENIDPVRDIEIVNYELIMKDMETVHKSLRDVQNKAKSGDKKYKADIEFYEKLYEHLSQGKLAKDFIISEIDHENYERLFLLTSKPVMFVSNVNENDLNTTDKFKLLQEYVKKNNAGLITVSAKIEDEISQLGSEDQKIFLEDLGLSESGLVKFIREGYDLLQLITFFTHNEKEVHAWTVQKNTKAPKAAGKIHTDFEKGFIKAEIIKYNDILKFGSEHLLRERGLIGIHGHDYIVQDGDIIFFRFHV